MAPDWPVQSITQMSMLQNAGQPASKTMSGLQLAAAVTAAFWHAGRTKKQAQLQLPTSSHFKSLSRSPDVDHLHV